MAAGAACKLRYDASHKVMKQVRYNNRNTHRFLKEESNNVYTNIHRFEMYYAATLSNGYAEISAPNAVFDGIATPIVVYAISSSASDTNVGGAGHAEKVTVIGIDENDAFVNVEIALNGTTQVSSVTKFKRIMHAYVSEWGSGGDDAAGNITITNTGQAATYLTIAAGSNESDGAAIFIPASHFFVFDHVELWTTSAANALSTANVKYTLTGIGNGADADFDYHPYRSNISSGGVHEVDDDIYEVPASTEGKITFSETYTGAAVDAWVKIEVLLWS